MNGPSPHARTRSQEPGAPRGERLPAILTIVVLAVAFILAALLRPGTDAAPETVVHASLEAARSGDLRAYLDCFVDPLRAKLDASRRESGDRAFLDAIRTRATQMTGLAISAPPTTPDPQGSRSLRVEFIFRDRAEAQEFRLSRSRGRWRIADAGPSSTFRMPVPYGTPVMPDPPAPQTPPASQPADPGPGDARR